MSLTKQKESLIRDRDRLAAEVEDLNKKLQQQRIQTEAVEKKRAEYEEKCRELYKSLDVSVLNWRKCCNKLISVRQFNRKHQARRLRRNEP